jgi:hypothetical protein
MGPGEDGTLYCYRCLQLEQKATINVGAGDQFTIQMEPKVLVPRGIVLYLQGREVGSADITVDVTNVPPELHHLVISFAGSMRNSVYLDGMMKEREPPTKKSVESWWKKLWKKKKRT